VIRRISVRSQPGQIVVPSDPVSKKPTTIKRASRVAQGIDPEFKPQYLKNKTKHPHKV
jgi:hypothetical protein